MTKTRLEIAKDYYNEGVSNANPTIENSIYNIKRDLLCNIYEDIFDNKPTKNEQVWLDSEIEIVIAYLNTEAF